MISKEFQFFAPREVTHVLSLLKGHGERAKLLAGGMSLMPTMNLGLVRPEVIVSLNHIPALDYIKEDADILKIGAMVRHSDVATNSLIRKFCPFLGEAASVIGDVQVRHRGTIGGSIVHADPAADYLTVMLAVDARFKLQSGDKERVVRAGEFILDIMQTDIRPSELLVEIQITKLRKSCTSAYVRLARVEGNYAIVNAAAIVDQELGSVRVVIGGVCPKPVVLDLPIKVNKIPSDEALRRIGRAVYEACEEAYGDLVGDAEYRRAMAEVYAQRAVKAAVAS